MIREVKISNQLVKIEVSDDNHVAEFFDLDKFLSEWHKIRTNEYHISLLIQCLKYYFFLIIYGLPENQDVRFKAINYLGSLIHKEIQEFREKNSGFSIIERPIFTTIKIKYKFGIETFDIVGKIDLLDIKIHYLDDIKTLTFLPDVLETYPEENFEKYFGKYVVQVYVYTYILNNFHLIEDPIKIMRILLIKKSDLYTKIITIHYDNNIGEYFYQKIKKRAIYLHKYIKTNEIPKAELNQYCYNCNFLGLCDEGKIFVEEQKAPISFESIEFKKNFPEKKPYIKRNGNWKETKAFIEFKKKLKKGEIA